MLATFVEIVALHGFRSYAGLFKIELSFAFTCAVFFSWGISLLYSVAFSAGGIYGHSFWGTRRFVRWHDITAARTFRLANLSWLRIYAANGQVTWLTLFPVGKAQFQREMLLLAPPGNPVRTVATDA